MSSLFLFSRHPERSRGIQARSAARPTTPHPHIQTTRHPERSRGIRARSAARPTTPHPHIQPTRHPERSRGIQARSAARPTTPHLSKIRPLIRQINIFCLFFCYTTLILLCFDAYSAKISLYHKSLCGQAMNVRRYRIFRRRRR